MEGSGGVLGFWGQSDVISRSVGLLLLAMSVSSWVIILWKGWLLRRAGGDIQRGVAAFWSAASVPEARGRLAAIDRESMLLPLVEAALQQPAAGTLEAQPALGSQLTRRLRDALHAGLAQLQFGQVVLASIGSTAPFIGLFGTVWGIIDAFEGLGTAGSASLRAVAPGISEALVTTAIGLAAAIPAAIFYNVFGSRIKEMGTRMEDFAIEFQNFAERDFGG
jgi:biopolymer transport protein ExbB